MFRLNGKLVNLFSIKDLVDLKSSCPPELQQTDVSVLGNVTFIEACKLYARRSASGATCDCKSECATKHCPCKKAGVSCYMHKVYLGKFRNFHF
ncbi:unnamed protein product [Didymodactylos carnosus]|uniref:Uncharacterized protein n=1 Tax=Didymodactylos carnosus TaxID=1234261 RepID=A0A8S2CVJ6_9BILA|nr:unnamed protein product [Didymodactylos carnosus]CAF3559602.1 unnamed protein product [Didymodactylos carnosus]